MAANLFTQAQKLAWDWVVSAVDEGMSAAAALRDYREGGGAIRTQDWYRLYNQQVSYGEEWSKQSHFRTNETYPEDMWGEAPRNFSNRYVGEVEFQKRNLLTGELETTFRYIEADYRMSFDEIRTNLEILGMDYIEDEQWTVEYIKGVKLYKQGQVR